MKGVVSIKKALPPHVCDGLKITSFFLVAVEVSDASGEPSYSEDHASCVVVKKNCSHTDQVKIKDKMYCRLCRLCRKSMK